MGKRSPSHFVADQPNQTAVPSRSKIITSSVPVSARIDPSLPFTIPVSVPFSVPVSSSTRIIHHQFSSPVPSQDTTKKAIFTPSPMKNALSLSSDNKGKKSTMRTKSKNIPAINGNHMSAVKSTDSSIYDIADYDMTNSSKFYDRFDKAENNSNLHENIKNLSNKLLIAENEKICIRVTLIAIWSIFFINSKSQKEAILILCPFLSVQ